MLLPNIDIDSFAPMYALCDDFPENCLPMMGLHPGSVDSNWESHLQVIRRNLEQRKHVAVGEIGMDLYWDKTYLQEQREAFRTQVRWAKELDLPVVIHAREAFDEIFSILDEENDSSLRGVFHCFTGTVEQAHRVMDYQGFKLAIGGVLTYKKSGLDEVVAQLPLDWLVLETDSPYLPPVPHRGKRNESAYLLHIAERLAEVKQVSLAEVALITSEAAADLFRLTISQQK